MLNYAQKAGDVLPISFYILLSDIIYIPPFKCSVAITEYEHRDFSLVDVNAAGCSKGTTLARWAASRGLTFGEIMAVGDNLNDVEMLDFAGTAVVMGNATDALKSRGYHLTGSNDEAGLAEAIRRYALSKARGRHLTRPSTDAR